MSKVRKKRCVICNELFTPQYTSLQKACSPLHAIQYSKLKEAAKVSSLNKLRNEKIDLETLSKALDNTRIIVNKFIRMRDKGKNCISCGFPLKGVYDAGHVFSVNQHSGIRFYEPNIFGQCMQCNRYNEGEHVKAKLNAKERLTVSEYDNLEKRAKIALRIPYTWTRTELKEIRKEFSNKIKQLEL